MERVTNEAKKKDIGILLLQDDLMPLLLVDISERAEISPVFFPSSRFFAYESNEDGTYQIYEKEISSLTNQSISLSRDWGTGFNIWSQDRFEIFFCSIGKKLADKVKLEPEMYFSCQRNYWRFLV